MASGENFSQLSIDTEKKRKTDQEEWEILQQSMTQSTVGAQDKQKQGEDYDLVEATEIEFVESCIEKGINVEQLLAENKKQEEQKRNACKRGY